MISRAVLVLASAAALALLSGCAPLAGPTDEDRAAWQEWFQTSTDASDGNTAGAMFSSADSDAGAGADSSGDATVGVRLDFASPQTFSAVELRCIGADRGHFTLTYTGTGGSTTLTQDIVCHGGGLRTPIAIPTASQTLTAFTADASSSGGEGYWVAILQP